MKKNAGRYFGGKNKGLRLVAPAIAPALDPHFRPAVLANHAFRAAVKRSGTAQPLRLALEQADGSVFHYATEIFGEHPSERKSEEFYKEMTAESERMVERFQNAPISPVLRLLGASRDKQIALIQKNITQLNSSSERIKRTSNKFNGNFIYVERLVKFLLWSWGGCRIYFDGPQVLGDQLAQHFRDTATGKFDSNLIGEKIYDRPIEVVVTSDLPPARAATKPLGRHLNGCRIGFDLGGSDRKVAAVIDGQVVFSDETVWDPYFHPDPQYHFDGIMDSLKRAAAYLPRVDAIGGSAAGVYVNNRVKVASLFRGVAPDVFEKRVKNLFFEVQRAMGGVPLEVVNDGEVTALAGSMSLGKNAVLGLALGTSLAAGYVTRDGNITSWLNELAFAPVDYHPAAPRDEWSGDYGVGAQYFSQQAVARLMPAAGIGVDANLPLPDKLKHVQALMAQGDERARKLYQTLGTYLGYAIAHYADFYDFDHVLILGRVTSGSGGDVIIEGAKAVLKLEFPELAGRIAFHTPDEKDKRHGQAVAAASLPQIEK